MSKPIKISLGRKTDRKVLRAIFTALIGKTVTVFEPGETSLSGKAVSEPALTGVVTKADMGGIEVEQKGFSTIPYPWECIDKVQLETP